MAFPLVYIIFAATSFDIPISSCIRLLLSPVFYLVAGVGMAAGYGFWEMRRWSWYVFMTFQGLVFYLDAIIASDYAESHHKIFILVISLVVQVLVAFRLAREIRVPYFFPKIRWWESNPRYRLSIPVSIQRNGGDTILAEILDLSVAGCFIKLRAVMPLNEPVSLNFRMYGQNIVIPGTIVWDAMSTVTHPKGIGVIFEKLPKEQRKALRAISTRLKQIASHYRRSRYWMEPKEFEQILTEIESGPLERSKFLLLAGHKGFNPGMIKRMGKGS